MTAQLCVLHLVCVFSCPWELSYLSTKQTSETGQLMDLESRLIERQGWPKISKGRHLSISCSMQPTVAYGHWASACVVRSPALELTICTTHSISPLCRSHVCVCGLEGYTFCLCGLAWALGCFCNLDFRLLKTIAKDVTLTENRINDNRVKSRVLC